MMNKTNVKKYTDEQIITQVESWKPVLDFEKFYLVSDLGRIKSLHKKLRSRGGNEYLTKERLINGTISMFGYRIVYLRNETGKIFRFQIHRLVIYSFLGKENFSINSVVDHKNGNKLDNRLENLEYVTARENVRRYHDKTNKKSIHRGVGYHIQSGRWTAQVTINSKKKHIGMFSDDYSAHLAYVDYINKHSLV